MTADKTLVRECPFLTMVPVMAVSDLVAAPLSNQGLDPVGDIFKPIATGPGPVHFEMVRFQDGEGDEDEEEGRGRVG